MPVSSELLPRPGGLSVLMLSPQFRPILGGYERAAERLSAALAMAGLRVVVITERRNRAWPSSECLDGYNVRRLSCWYRHNFHVVTSLLSFAVFLLRHGRGFDVWHAHQYGYHAALAVALGRLLRRPVVLKMTSSAGTGIGTASGRGIVGGISRYFQRRVSACLAVSCETRTEALSFGIAPEVVHLIPNGIDSRQFSPATPEERADARRTLGLDCMRVVLYVGRLSSEKNPLGLLDAWAAIEPEARKSTLLVLVGDGPEWQQVSARAQMGDLAGHVRLAGPQSDVSHWYRAADIYVLSSHQEGLSNTMIEALASGLPVISTRVSGSQILVESPSAGVVVDCGDVQQLARAMKSLLHDTTARTALGRNARLKFESSFALEAVSGKMIALYRHVLEQSGSGGTAPCAG